MKRKPTASDRNITEALQAIPRGVYSVIVEANDHRPMLKVEGSTWFMLGDNRIGFMCRREVKK